MTFQERYVEECWTQVRGLVTAIEERTREGYKNGLLASDERLGELETKASGLAQAIHDIRLMRRLGRWRPKVSDDQRNLSALTFKDGETPNVLIGLLGWSNKRSGVEFYRWDDKIIPRHGSEWGDLLAENESIAKAEGAPVIVVALPRATTPEQVHEIAALIHGVFK